MNTHKVCLLLLLFFPCFVCGCLGNVAKVAGLWGASFDVSDFGHHVSSIGMYSDFLKRKECVGHTLLF